MNQKSFGEIKRRLNPDKRNPSVIRGCYMAADGHIISEFQEAVGRLSEEDNQKYMSVFRKVLSGTPGQNLLDIRFSDEQVRDDDAYALLKNMQQSALKDEESLEAFYQKVIAYVQSFASAAQSIDEMNAMPNYAVLMLHDGMDVKYRDSNGEVDNERSVMSFSYILCAVCPVKQTKPVLGFDAGEGSFRNMEANWAVTAPELGFMYPAYEDGAADVYSAIYYTRDAADMHDLFVQNVFHTDVYMPAAEQKETFRSILSESLGEECSLEMVQSINEAVCAMIDEQKADKQAEPLQLSKESVSQVLTGCGVSEEKAQAFESKYTETFGEYAELPAVNMVSSRQLKVSTPSVSIQVSADHADLVQTREIDGKTYIMVLVDDAVEVNGIPVRV